MYLPKYCPSGPHPDILLLRLEFSLGDDDTIFKNSEIKNARRINACTQDSVVKRILPGLQLPLIELTKNFLGPCDQKNSNGQLERGVQLKR